LLLIAVCCGIEIENGMENGEFEVRRGCEICGNLWLVIDL